MNVVHVALLNYKSETERYLAAYRSWPLTNPYDPECCNTCSHEHSRWTVGEDSRQALLARLAEINDALASVTSEGSVP